MINTDDKKLWHILLAFQGTSMYAQISIHDEATRLYPFMTGAVTKERPLDFVYKMMMETDPSVRDINNISMLSIFLNHGTCLCI